MTSLCWRIGTTISDFESELQAMCPGNCSTSGTISPGLFPSCAANSFAEADAGAGNGTLKRTQYEFILFHKVKAYPKETESLFERCCNVGKIGYEIRFRTYQSV